MKLTQMSHKDMKRFKPSLDMIKAAQLVFFNLAVVETVKPIVRGYQQKILLKYRMKYAKESERKHFGTDYITNPDHVYLLSDTDFNIYLSECHKEQEKVGLKTDDPDHCPLLIAENILRKSENLLIDSFEHVTGLKSSDINMNLEIRNKFLELTLSYMSQFVDSKSIKQGVRK